MMLVGSLAVFAAPLLLPADPAADRTGRGSTSPGRPGDRRAVRLVHGLTIAAESGKATATSVGTLLAATVALGGFVLVQRTRRHPLVPTALLRSPPIAAANVVGFVLGAAVHGLFYVLSLFLGGIRGDEPMLIGLPFLPMTGAIVVGSAATSRLRGRVGAWWLLLASVALLALALATSRGHRPPADTSPRSCPLSCWPDWASVSRSSRSPPSLWARAADEHSGAAAGVFEAALQLGGALGLAVFVAAATARSRTLLAVGTSSPAADQRKRPRPRARRRAGPAHRAAHRAHRRTRPRQEHNTLPALLHFADRPSPS